MLKLVVILLAGYASQGGRASVTYQPTLLKGDGQGCPSNENMAQAIENIHSLIEERVETESTPEIRLLTELNTAVETLSQEVANNSQTTNGTLTELSQEVAELSNNSETVNETLTELISRDETASILQAINDNPRGLSQALPAGSCRTISEDRPDLPSGNYWIRSSNGTAVQVYCDMARQCCGGTTGGWTRVAYLDMTDPNQQCPPAWREITSPVRTCGKQIPVSCESANYPTHGVSYNRVCGQVRGYQYCSTNSFTRFSTDIDSLYVDGVSITRGSSPRQHVWSFAAAYSATDNPSSCPCIANPNSANDRVSAFVGEDYFCDTAFALSNPFPVCGSVLANLQVAHPLWDGGGCGPTGGCCENNNPPWFCKTLPQPTTDDIEVRLCIDEPTDEDVLIELIELYIN